VGVIPKFTSIAPLFRYANDSVCFPTAPKYF